MNTTGSTRRREAGIEPRHARSCPTPGDPEARCRCRPGWRAEVYDRRTGRKIRKTLPTFAAAKAWRADALSAMGRGELRATASKTVREAGEELLAGMEDGTVRAKTGRPYKPSAIESYRASLERHVLPDLGAHRLADVGPQDVQALADRMRLSGQTVRNAMTALSVVYRLAKRRGWVMVNPCAGLELPQGARRRERVVDPAEARVLLEPLPIDLRALYGLAVYAGLRRGEIAGLRWQDVRFDEKVAGGTIVVERAWCWRAKGFVDPKSEAGRREVPMVSVLAELLLAWSVEHPGGELVFPSAREPGRPFDPRAVARRAETAWKQEAERKAREAGEDPKRATWERVILHEGRHSAASAFIAAGEDAVQVAAWLGHSQTSTTTDIYGHAFKDRERQAAKRQRLEVFFREREPAE